MVAAGARTKGKGNWEPQVRLDHLKQVESGQGRLPLWAQLGVEEAARRVLDLGVGPGCPEEQQLALRMSTLCLELASSPAKTDLGAQRPVTQQWFGMRSSDALLVS